MFKHSVKVPRHYKVAANIVKKVATEGGSVKTLLYDDKLKHFRTNVLYALITETIKHAADIDKIFEHCELFQKEPRFDQWLAKVLTAELLFGKKSLPGKSKPEQTIVSYKDQFEQYISEHQDDLKTEDQPRPRYVRINTNLLTTSDAIRAFQDEGYRFIRCTSGSYSDYLEQIQNLTEYDFTQDYHVKTIFVFPPGTKWHDHELYLENKIILQDKATALAVHLLAPPAGSTVLDLCAAPGMKTTQVAAYLRNEGKVYAIERNPERYQTLCDFVEKTGCKCVQTFNKDSLDIKKGEFDDAEYILLDPSCSGSGMSMTVHNYVDAVRLARLTSLQEKFLKHTMNAFPNAKRIVYSTCSLFPEENERVITNVVKTSRTKWRVQDVKQLLKEQWNHFGSAMYGSMGTRCLYAKPESDLTTGFFLAVLDRDEKDLAKAGLKEKKVKDTDAVNGTDMDVDVPKKGKKDKRIKENDHDSDSQDKDTDAVNGTDIDVDVPKKGKKDKRKKENDQGSDSQDNVKLNSEVEVEVRKTKKHKRKRDDENYLESQENIEIENEINAEKHKKKNKKRKHNDKIDSEDNKEGTNGMDVESPKKVKKQKIHQELENDSDLQIIEDIPKKKKKDKYKEVVTDITETENTKKKRKKNKNPINENGVLDKIMDNLVDLNVEQEPPKKKKKNKSLEIV